MKPISVSTAHETTISLIVRNERSIERNNSILVADAPTEGADPVANE